MADLEVGNLNREESKNSADSYSLYYSSKYFNGFSGRNCERKMSEVGSNNHTNIDTAVIKFNRRSSGYGTIGAHMPLAHHSSLGQETFRTQNS